MAKRIKPAYTILTWNHRTCKAGKFAFLPTLEAARKYADEYVRYLDENQVQVSETATYPVKVVYRLWNHKGEVRDLTVL